MRALVPRDLESIGVIVAFFERTGGASEGPFSSLNGSLTGGDDRAAVLDNRRRASAALGIDAYAVPGLVHGIRVDRVDAATATDGRDEPARVFGGADGLYADDPAVALGAYSGDCVIVAMASPRQGRTALVHAGWRGLATGILRRAVSVFDDPTDVRVAIGPAIGPCHYEVGAEVVDAVRAAVPDPPVRRASGRTFLDLAGSTGSALRAAGVRSIADSGVCTACEIGRFFSYRTERRTGRHLALTARLDRPDILRL